MDSARKGDDPNAIGYYLMGEIDKALQKARIELLLKLRPIADQMEAGLWSGEEDDIVEVIDKELREESNT